MNRNQVAQNIQPSTSAAIACSNLHSPFLAALKRPALDGVNCVIRSGEFVTLLGLNGAGKSTLLRSLVGLVPIQKGNIHINGVAVNSKALRQRRDVSILFQGGGLVPQLTALENVLCGCLGQRSTWQTLTGFRRSDRLRALQLLQELGLDAQIDQKTSQLSGGQRQRVAIARVLIQSPKILLVDEPITGLDVLAAKQVMDIFSHLHQQGMTIVSVLHDLTIAAHYAQRAIVLNAGRVVYDGACENLPDHLSLGNP
ncbi:phosphonate ABC transporter ATP-binding protein [Phormidesmis sp. 146-35]